METLYIDSIIEDSSLQIRQQLDKQTIAQYSECIDQLPPVVVFKTNRKGKELYLLADGYHRLAAHRQAGIDQIQAKVKEGDAREAYGYALTANCKHGLPLTRKEKRKAVEGMLKLYTERTDRWIGRDIGVSKNTVAAARSRLESNGQIDHCSEFIGKDGRRWNREARSNGRGPTTAPTPEPEESTSPPPDPWAGKIIQADCIDWLAQDDSRYDLIFADPPYGILNEEWEPADIIAFTTKWLKVAIPRLKPSGRIYICFSQRYMFDLKPIVDKLGQTSLTFGGALIWNYRNVFNKKYNPATYKPTYEPVFYWYGPEAGPLNYDTEWNEERGDVWTLAMPQSNYTDKKEHPAQKPLELMRGIVRTASNFGDFILDPFAGSGTTAVAAQELGRQWRVIEQDQDYINLIRGRLSQWG